MPLRTRRWGRPSWAGQPAGSNMLTMICTLSTLFPLFYSVLPRHLDSLRSSRLARSQEVDEMLQSKMSVEDEEAVQAELAAMEEEQVSRLFCLFVILIAHEDSLVADPPQSPTSPGCTDKGAHIARGRTGYRYAVLQYVYTSIEADRDCSLCRRSYTDTRGKTARTKGGVARLAR